MAEKEKQKNRVLRIIGATILIAFIGLVLFIANLLFGNPISKAIAKNKIEPYVKMVYDYTGDINMGYNVVSGRYYGDTPHGIFDYYSNGTIYDEKFSNYYSDLFARDFAKIAKEMKLKFISPRTTVSSFIKANGKYSKDFSQMDKRQSLEMMLRIDSRENQDFYMAKTIYDILEKLKGTYNITFFKIYFSNDNYTYAFKLRDKKNFSIEDIQKSMKTYERTEEDKRLNDGMYVDSQYGNTQKD